MSNRIFAMVSTEASKKYTPLALESFFKFTPLNPGEKLILIDNDGSLPMSQSGQLEYVKPKKPRSFAGNFNWILSKAKKESADIYFLNNDIIFTPDWILPLESATDSIITPVSNREFQYRGDGLRLEVSCRLEDYLENKEQLNKIVLHHKRKFATSNLGSRRKVLSLPFFCVKIPKAVWGVLGNLDESFGKGGAEDNDYCLRAYLEGFKVEYALESYLLHFSGKSTWDGAESAVETSARDELYRTKFKDKWGENLLKLSILGDISPLYSAPDLIGLFQQGNFTEVISKLKSL
jgi:GT2 family glycosyltransferase